MRISDVSSDVCSADLATSGDHPLGHSLVAPAQQHRTRFRRQRPGPRLIEPPSARTEIDPWSGTILDRGERRIDDIRPHDHTVAPTEPGIVYGAVLIARETSDVPHFQRPYSRRESLRSEAHTSNIQSLIRIL